MSDRFLLLRKCTRPFIQIKENYLNGMSNPIQGKIKTLKTSDCSALFKFSM